MTDKKILFVSQQISPYLPGNEISSFCKSLPQALQGKGFEIRTFMPKFGAINERRNQLHEVIRLSGLNIEIDNEDHPLILKVASMQPARIQVYFIDNDDYFLKSGDDIDVFGSNRKDNDERAIYFARGTMETVKKLRWEPKIIQCSGWMTALTPLYMKRKNTEERLWDNSKVIYCIEPHNPEMAMLSPRLKEKLENDGIILNDSDSQILENPDINSLHKLAVNQAAGVIFLTDSPDPDLLDYVKSKNIPYILKDKALDGVNSILEFYGNV